MIFTRNICTESASGLLNSSGFAGLSSKRPGHQAFNLIIRVQTPSTLFFFCVQSVLQKLLSPMILKKFSILSSQIWCCRPVVQDSALSARKSGVQIPSAPPWERSSSGKITVCETAHTGSIPVLSPTPRSFNGRTQRSERCCGGSIPSLGEFSLRTDFLI